MSQRTDAGSFPLLDDDDDDDDESDFPALLVGVVKAGRRLAPAVPPTPFLTQGQRSTTVHHLQSPAPKRAKQN